MAGSLVQAWTDDGVGHVRLACPERLNAIDMALARELLAAVQAAGADPAVRCLVLSGAGPAFSSGGDIGALAALPAADTLALTDTVLVDVVAPAGELLGAAVALARRIARNGPLAVRAIMRILREQDAPALRRGLAGTAEALEEMLGSADAYEGLTAFVERRPPAFEGR